MAPDLDMQLATIARFIIKANNKHNAQSLISWSDRISNPRPRSAYECSQPVKPCSLGKRWQSIFRDRGIPYMKFH